MSIKKLASNPFHENELLMPSVQSGYIFPSNLRGPCVRKPVVGLITMLPCGSRNQPTPCKLKVSPGRATTKMPKPSPEVVMNSCKPSAKDSTRLMLRLKLKAASQRKPDRVLMGLMVSMASTPLLESSPTFKRRAE